MESTFQKINLGRIAEFRNGLNYSKKDVGKGLKVIGVTDFQDRIYPLYNELEEVNPDDISISDEQFLKEDDILFVRSNGNRELVGRTLIIKNIKERISHSGFTIRLRFIEDEVNPYFHLYVFKSPQFRKQIANYGGARILAISINLFLMILRYQTLKSMFKIESPQSSLPLMT